MSQEHKMLKFEVEERLLPDEISSFDEDLPSTFSIFTLHNKTNSKQNNKLMLSISDIEQNNVSCNENNTTMLFSSTQGFQLSTNADTKVHQFKPVHPDTVWVNAKGSFAYVRCQLITTFFFGSLNFSQFSNPFLIENDPRYELKFLYLGNNAECEGSCFELYDEFSLDNIDNKDLGAFVHGLNKFFLESRYLSLTKSYQIKKTLFDVLYYFLVFILVGICGYLAYYITASVANGQEIQTIFWIVLGCALGGILLLAIGLVLIRLKLKRIRMLLIEKETVLRIKNHKEIFKFIDDWNTKLFLPNKIAMSMPITLHYVMFNLEKHGDIQIIPHDIGEVTPKKLF